ncbi:uncharacterized protein [Diadema setosum]|uniref:uncharacterized protein n=1 Tax=Diadema setosum TaxID=31175 RepID=UPI003B3B6B4F
MSVDDYTKIKKGSDHTVDGQMATLQNWEQQLVKCLWRVELVGKRGRTVPLMMTNFVKSCMDALMRYRTEVGVNPRNKYFFALARTDIMSHVRGCDTLREHAQKCGAVQPTLLTSTGLRKHIATMTQLLSLRENEMDVLANYMGHDLHIHREFYRLPDAAQQVAKISKLLFAMEGKGGNPVEVLSRARSIDDLPLQPNEGRFEI